MEESHKYHSYFCLQTTTTTTTTTDTVKIWLRNLIQKSKNYQSSTKFKTMWKVCSLMILFNNLITSHIVTEMNILPRTWHQHSRCALTTDRYFILMQLTVCGECISEHKFKMCFVQQIPESCPILISGCVPKLLQDRGWRKNILPGYRTGDWEHWSF